MGLSWTNAVDDDIFDFGFDCFLEIDSELFFQDRFEVVVVHDRVLFMFERSFVEGVVGEMTFKIVDIGELILLWADSDVAMWEHVDL